EAQLRAFRDGGHAEVGAGRIVAVNAANQSFQFRVGGAAAPEREGDRFEGAVVMGRPDASTRHHEIVVFTQAREFAGDLTDVVAHQGASRQAYAKGPEALGQRV